MSVKVGMRMRPMVGHEKGQLPCLSIAGDEISIMHQNLSEEDQEQYEDQTDPFKFDIVMDSSDHSSPSYVDNGKCYELMARPLVEQVLQGYNACLFCYGQTGTGKTATIMGYPDLGPGLLPRMLEDMIGQANTLRSEGSTVTLTVQFIEVYNDGLNDLLVDRDRWEDVSIKTRALPTGVIISGATERQVTTVDECIALLDEGTARKTVAPTKMNPTSSRGHTVFKLSFDTAGGKKATKMHCEVYFADLAGHENIKTTAVTGARLTELTHINSSLMYLQRAVEDMAKASPKKKKGRLNLSAFRNCELTLVMANGLLGNSKAYVIVTLSPAAAHFDTSFESIEFALEVKGIKLEVTANVAVDPQAKIRQLQNEVASLKKELAECRALNQQLVWPDQEMPEAPANPSTSKAGKSEKGEKNEKGDKSDKKKGKKEKSTDKLKEKDAGKDLVNSLSPAFVVTDAMKPDWKNVPNPAGEGIKTALLSATNAVTAPASEAVQEIEARMQRLKQAHTDDVKELQVLNEQLAIQIETLTKENEGLLASVAFAEAQLSECRRQGRHNPLAFFARRRPD